MKQSNINFLSFPSDFKLPTFTLHLNYSCAKLRTDRCGQRRGWQPTRASADDLLVSPPWSCGLRPTWVRRRTAASRAGIRWKKVDSNIRPRKYSLCCCACCLFLFAFSCFFLLFFRVYWEPSPLLWSSSDIINCANWYILPLYFVLVFFDSLIM